MNAKTSLLVLIVDDNHDFADSIAEWLRSYGHIVHVAYDAPSGLRAAKYIVPQLILHDIELPGMYGFDAVRLLRNEALLQGTMLVAVTGSAEPEIEAKTKAAGFDRYIPKPIPYRAMLDVLNEVAQGAAQ